MMNLKIMGACRWNRNSISTGCSLRARRSSSAPRFRPFKLSDVISELHTIDGLPGVTISEVKRFGKSSAKDIERKQNDCLIEYVDKIKIEIVVNDDMVDKVVSVIQKIAHTGNTGDGKIFIIPVEDTIIIRTNERGNTAI